MNVITCMKCSCEYTYYYTVDYKEGEGSSVIQSEIKESNDTTFTTATTTTATTSSTIDTAANEGVYYDININVHSYIVSLIICV